MSIERVKAYKKRDYRGLVGKVLVSVIFIFFVLSCHFHIWSGAYQEGDLESAAVHSQEILADSMYGSGGTEELKEFLSLAYLAFILADVCLSWALYERRQIFCLWCNRFRKILTLQSLEVRLDH